MAMVCSYSMLGGMVCGSGQCTVQTLATPAHGCSGSYGKSSQQVRPGGHMLGLPAVELSTQSSRC